MTKNLSFQIDHEYIQHGPVVDYGLIRLYQAVIKGALFDLADKAHTESAENWIFDNRPYPFSFLQTCAVLRLNPVAVREKVRGWLSIEKKQLRRDLRLTFSQTAMHKRDRNSLGEQRRKRDYCRI
jgi:hypothetical protein